MIARSAVAMFGCLTLLSAGAGEAAAEDRLAVVVHAARTDTLSMEDVAQIYLKKRRFWKDGNVIVPINREASSLARGAFTRAILGNQARRLDVYWNREYFRGVLPPATLASDDAVKRFVVLEPNAIGYVDARIVDDSLRVLFYIPVR